MRRSAGILLWRRSKGAIEVLLGHPGGPMFTPKDDDHWSVLKGEIEAGEEEFAVARREFEEESGYPVPDGDAIELGEIQQKGGKYVAAWAVEGDLDVASAVSNTFEVEWPPKSGRLQSFPEIDRVEWFDLPTARVKVKAAQEPFLDRLAAALGDDEDMPDLG